MADDRADPSRLPRRAPVISSLARSLRVPPVKSARGPIAPYEAYIAARLNEIETGEYMVDTATTRKWHVWGGGELKTWKGILQRAIDDEKPKTSLA